MLLKYWLFQNWKSPQNEIATEIEKTQQYHIRPQPNITYLMKKNHFKILKYKQEEFVKKTSISLSLDCECCYETEGGS